MTLERYTLLFFLPSFSGLFRESCVNNHLCNNKANLLTRLVPCCNKILGTDCALRPRMTGARSACFVPPARLPRCARNNDGARGEVIGLLLCLLLSHISFFPPNPAKTH